MRTWSLRAIVSVFALVIVPGARAAPGDLDTSFATVGFVAHPGEFDPKVAVQPDGRVLAAVGDGGAGLLVTRRGLGGNLDPSWGGDGRVTANVGAGRDSVTGLLVQPDDKVLVAVIIGSGTLHFVRFNPGGAQDDTFGGGIVATSIEASAGGDRLALQPDGKVLGSGEFAGSFAVVRHLANGAPDAAFAGTGVAVVDVPGTGEAHAVAVQADGKILLAGVANGDATVVRLFPTGVPDPSFGAGGIATFEAGGPEDDLVNDVAIHADGSIVVAATDADAGAGPFEPGRAVLARLLPSGALDPSFGSGGQVSVALDPDAFHAGAAVAPQGDGKTIFVGAFFAESGPLFQAFLARFDGAGAADPSWGGTGVVVEDYGLPFGATATSAVIGAGRLVLGGGTIQSEAAFVVSRFEIGEFCGDGVVQPGEDCDDASFSPGDCCSPACTYEPSGALCADEGDACTSNECDGAGTCLHPLAPDGSACEDGNSCTVGEACSAGVCEGGVPGGIGCTNPFLCYQSRATKGHPAFQRKNRLELEDPLESGEFDATAQFELCVPAQVNDVEVLDPEIRQIAYKIKPSPGEDKHVKRSGIAVEDHFGMHTFDTTKAELLFVPADLELGAPATAPALGTALHYKCYKVKQSKGTPRFGQAKVTATDELEDRFYDVYQPRRLCYAVDKEGEGVLDPEAALTCYRVRRAAGQPPHERVEDLIRTADQFGGLRLDTKREKDLCLPATVLP